MTFFFNLFQKFHQDLVYLKTYTLFHQPIPLLPLLPLHPLLPLLPLHPLLPLLLFREVV